MTELKRRPRHGLWAAMRRLQPVSASWVETLLFLAAQHWPAARGWPFRFRRAGRPFWVRPADAAALEDVLLNHEYDFVVEVVRRPGPAPVIIDAGANIGLFSRMILDARPDAHVHSLEPGAPAYRVLQRNWAARRPAAWQLHPLALWQTAGPIQFSNRAASTSSRVAALGSQEGLATVPAVTLPGFWEQHVRGPVTLLKLDIEGAEEVVLSQGEGVLAQIEHLVVEIHPPAADTERMEALLRRHFVHLERLGGRASSKPLIWARRTERAAAE
ncbi:MAG: FkbM family methyltransferase [Anaerolineales bacterium]|nr:FkbM family methyltransferase [Anaerolineales bacterium]